MKTVTEVFHVFPILLPPLWRLAENYWNWQLILKRCLKMVVYEQTPSGMVGDFVHWITVFHSSKIPQTFLIFLKGTGMGISEACQPVFRVGRSWAKRAFEEQQRTLELSMWITSWCDPSQSSSFAMSRDVRPAELTWAQALFQLPAAWITVLKSFMLLTSHCSWQICKWLNPYCW